MADYALLGRTLKPEIRKKVVSSSDQPRRDRGHSRALAAMGPRSRWREQVRGYRDQGTIYADIETSSS